MLDAVFLVTLIVQCATYVVLAPVLIARGQWKLGVAQLLLAVVQALVYS